MATLTINVLEMYQKLGEKGATTREMKIFQRKLEQRIAAWGRQFPESTFHEKHKMKAPMALLLRPNSEILEHMPSLIRTLNRNLILDNIPDEAAEHFFEEVFPELTPGEDIAALPEKTDEDGM